MNATTCEDKICERSGHGLVLPIFRESENDWPNGLRIVLYFIGLMWFFMGVAIVADCFMSAIERITSSKKRVWDKEFAHSMTVKVWNDSVANLTLMALGSSAPEILLSIIELLGADFYSGDLGPSTIVGSAAFNLFVIIAICVSAIPTGEERKIADLSVFAVTATFSVFAYLWLYLIVSVWTPDIVTIAEGLITFLLFPVLVLIAYLADRGYFSNREDAETSHVLLQDAAKHEIAAMEMKVLQKYGQGKTLSNEEIAELMQREFGEKPSRAARRVNATRAITGGAKVKIARQKTAKDGVTVVSSNEVTVEKPEMATVGFLFEAYSVLENVGNLDLRVKRTGPPEQGTCRVKYKTRAEEGAGKPGENYKHAEGILEFTQKDQECIIRVEILDNDAVNTDMYFFVDLEDLECEGCKGELGLQTAHIRIVDDDEPGKLTFAKDTFYVKETTTDVVARVIVERQSGCKGKISVKYKTEDDSAVAGRDYEAVTEGVLEFENAQETAAIEIVIKPRGRYETSETFRVKLFEPTGGASFVKHRDGGEDEAICEVCIESDEDQQERFARVMSHLKLNFDQASLGYSNWADQFKAAISVNGGGEEEEDPPGIFDWVMHILTVPWKLLFAFIPPVDYCGGWLCFVCALLMIGLVTALIGDLAALLGCVLGIQDSITAITFVALGTSLPDTFASKSAAVDDETADASVGNVTGSNSVNVFLGLGLPWLMGSLHWAISGKDKLQEWGEKYRPLDPRFEFSDYPEGAFVVIGGSLGFSVSVFTMCAIMCIIVMVIRRMTPSIGAELGGPDPLKYVTSVFMLCLWFFYIGASIWKAIDTKGPCD